VKTTTRQYKMPQSAGLPSRLQNALTSRQPDSSTSTSTASLSTSTIPTLRLCRGSLCGPTPRLPRASVTHRQRTTALDGGASVVDRSAVQRLDSLALLSLTDKRQRRWTAEPSTTMA
jgi:hypothetical protein